MKFRHTCENVNTLKLHKNTNAFSESRISKQISGESSSYKYSAIIKYKYVVIISASVFASVSQ